MCVHLPELGSLFLGNFSTSFLITTFSAACVFFRGRTSWKRPERSAEHHREEILTIYTQGDGEQSLIIEELTALGNGAVSEASLSTHNAPFLTS